MSALANQEQNYTLVFPSGARTATVNSGPLAVPHWARGCLARLLVTAGTTLDVAIGLDAYFPEDATAGVLATHGTALTGAGQQSLMLHPSVAASTSITNCTGVQIPLPGMLRVRVTHGNANSATYSVSLQWLP